MEDNIIGRNQTEEALRDANQFNFEIVSQAGEGIIVYDRNLRYKVWNRFMECLTGVLAEDVLGRNALDLFPHLHEQGVEKLLERALNGETVTSPDIQFYCTSTNKKGWVVGTYAPHRNACGEIIGVIATLQDVTERRRAEEAMRDSENKLATTIEFLPDATFVIDLEGRVVAWNKAMEEMTGVSKVDMIGQGDHAYTVPFYGERRQQLLDLIDKDDQEIASKYEYVQRKGDTLYAETFAPALHDGKGAYVWATGGPIFDVHGNRTGAIESIRDITERRRSEEALQEVERAAENSKAQYERAVSMISDIVWRYDVNAEGEKIGSYISPVADKMLGLPDGTVGDSFEKYFSYVHPEDLPGVRDILSKGLRTLARDLTTEYRLQKADGTTIWVRSKGSAYSQSDGRVTAFGTTSDITERKCMEEDLRKSKEMYGNIFENSIIGIFQSIPGGKYLSVNPAFARLFGYDTPEELIASVTDIGHQLYLNPLDRDRAIKTILEQGFLEGFELETRRKDGTKFWVSMNTIIEQDENGMRFDGTVEDITERKRAVEELCKARDELERRVDERTSELETKNSEMERFIYTVSHDLRTPLISMSGFMGFLKQDLEKGDPKRVEEDLRIVNDAVMKMDRLLLETLELSRIGRVVNPPEDVPFGEIVEDALKQTRSKIESKGFKVSVAQDLPVVNVDRMRIAEVLVNLIENSIKYTGSQGNPEIEIGQRTDGKDRVFFVRDNGIGIDPRQHEKVFELFYKVDKKSEGSGAGLAIVKKIIEVHGGRIWIESELGMGSTVCFTLPLANHR